jgi:hypothetical protein
MGMSETERVGVVDEAMKSPADSVARDVWRGLLKGFPSAHLPNYCPNK